MEIALIQYQDDHWYKVIEADIAYYLASVTTKLGIVDNPQLDRWRGDVGNREADHRAYEASNRGKRIHWAKEILLKGGAVVFDSWQNPTFTPEGIAQLQQDYNGNVAILRHQDEMHTVTKIKRQLDILKPKILGVELKVYDLEHRDAGTIDAIYEIAEGEYAIAGAEPLYLPAGIYVEDLKTGAMVDEKMWMQAAPYSYCYEQMFGLKIQGALITHTSAKIKRGIPGLKTLYRDRKTLFTKDYPDYRHAAALWEREHSDDKPHTFEFPSLITLKEPIPA